MTAAHQIQSSTLPPAQPAYVLRGHNAQIHSVCFLRQNTRLLTGDAQGWLVLWNVVSKRAVAVWRAHEGPILGLSSWGDDKIITKIPNIYKSEKADGHHVSHGRDTKLLVWQLREADEHSFSTVLPIEDEFTRRPDPWLLHSLEVNTLNFCPFAQCETRPGNSESLLVTVPGRSEGEIEVYSLPSQERLHTIPAPKGIKSGMVMALAVTHLHSDIAIVAGFESGSTCLWHKPATGAGDWKMAHAGNAHTQPVLSLAIDKSHAAYFTSAADAIVARHPLTLTKSSTAQGYDKSIQTKHAGQQGLVVRSDERILATAGWDGRVRVYSTKTMRELAVLKWHKQGCYALAFADLMSTSAAQKQQQADAEGADDLQITAQPYMTVAQQRNTKAQNTHWLAAGAKDGKVSLWDIY